MAQVNPEEDTEFNDALRKYGIIPPRAPTPPTPPPPASPTLDDLLDDFTPAELQEIAEDSKDDEMERVVDEYRRQRLAEDRAESKKARFGRVYPIGREDYTREVTEASLVNESDDDKDRGTAVICFLYKDGIPHSDRTKLHIQNLAARHPKSKFISIVGDKCIPNLPDVRIPMLIIYRKGAVIHQIAGWGAERVKSMEELEALLILYGAVDLPDRRKLNSMSTKEDESGSEDDEDDEASSRMRSAATRVNARPAKNIRSRGSKDDEDDSDFEFDM